MSAGSTRSGTAVCDGAESVEEETSLGPSSSVLSAMDYSMQAGDSPGTASGTDTAAREGAALSSSCCGGDVAMMDTMDYASGTTELLCSGARSC